jgi:hypothetical protein
VFDFMGLFDGLLNTVSLASSAKQVNDDSQDSQSEKITEETKEKMEFIVAEREQEMKQRRADQSQTTDQHRQQHKR